MKLNSRLKNDPLAKYKHTKIEYGGELLKRRVHRSHGRPISLFDSMHFVLRSEQARGQWSFTKRKHQISALISKFALKNDIEVLKEAIVGNHIHLHLQLSTTRKYKAFIRAVTSAIMMLVTGHSRWSPKKLVKKFWDRRPFSRIILGGLKARMRIDHYLEVNWFQGAGCTLKEAQFYAEWFRYPVEGPPDDEVHEGEF